jgi:3-deoxy-7-phosphoheptulonate synthase
MFQKIKEIPSPQEVKEKQGFNKLQKEIKLTRDKEITDILAGRDSRLLIVIGPCSADNEDAVCDYVFRLAKINEKVKDRLMLVPRIYTGKPRTKGEGYKGIFHSPDPKKGTDITEGLFAMRKMLIRAVAESGLTAADEMLYPENYDYIEDLLSYVAIGARSAENQYHRLVASGIDVPVGIKNPMNGSMDVLLNSINAAQIPNEFKYYGSQVKTSGNPYAHAIFRGAVDLNGINVPNYHYENVVNFSNAYQKSGLLNPAIIVDVNHSNSNKRAMHQTRIVKEILFNMREDKAYAKYLKGFMIESYIEDGRQEIGENVYGKSITDECLGWEKTAQLLYRIAESV